MGLLSSLQLEDTIWCSKALPLFGSVCDVTVHVPLHSLHHIPIGWNALWWDSLNKSLIISLKEQYVSLLDVISPQCLFCHWLCGIKNCATHQSCCMIKSAWCAYIFPTWYIDGLVQERHNSIANALELCLCYTNPIDLWLSLITIFLWFCVSCYQIFSGECTNKSRQGVEVRRLEYADSWASGTRFWRIVMNYEISLHLKVQSCQNIVIFLQNTPKNIYRCLLWVQMIIFMLKQGWGLNFQSFSAIDRSKQSSWGTGKLAKLSDVVNKLADEFWDEYFNPEKQRSSVDS